MERTPWMPIGQPMFWTVLALLVGVAYILFLRPTFPPGSDAWDYSQEARQLASGQGFTSLYTYPVHLTSEGPPFPVHWRMPLYSFLGAVLLRTGVSLPFGFLLLGLLSHAAIVLLSFQIARTLHSVLAGCIAAAALAASPLLLDPYDPGLNQVPTAALTTLVWYLLFCRTGWWSIASAAIAAAAAWYLRAESALLIPFWACAAWSGGSSCFPHTDGVRRCHDVPAGSAARLAWRRGAWFLGSFFLLVVPWLLNRIAASGEVMPIKGNPTLLYTPEYPGYSSARGLGAVLPSAIEYVTRHPGTFIVRYLKDFTGYLVDLLGAVGAIVVGLVLATALDQERRREYAPPEPTGPPRGSRRQAVLLAAAIVVQIGAVAALERSPRFLVAVLPTVCLLIGVAVAPYLQRTRSSWLITAVLLVIVGERYVKIALDRADAARRFPPIPPSVAQQLRPIASKWGPEALVLTDVPDWVAWQFERPALLLPGSGYLPDLLARRDVSAIYLSAAARGRNAADHDRGWLDVIDHCGGIPGFVGPIVLDDGSRVYDRTGNAGERHH